MEKRDDEELLGDGLLEEIEEWDRMFDSLHIPDVPGEELASAPPPAVTGAVAPGAARGGAAASAASAAGRSATETARRVAAPAAAAASEPAVSATRAARAAGSASAAEQDDDESENENDWSDVGATEAEVAALPPASDVAAAGRSAPPMRGPAAPGQAVPGPAARAAATGPERAGSRSTAPGPVPFGRSGPASTRPSPASTTSPPTASGPASRSQPMATFSGASAREDDLDPFPLLEDELLLDGEARALGSLLGSSGRRLPLGAEEDDGLFTSAVRPALGAAPDPAAARPAASGRRSAAIVRRPGAPPMRHGLPGGDARLRPGPGGEGSAAPFPLSDDDADSSFWPEERTQAVAAELVERLAESAEALFRDAPPEVVLQLDEDFYEGIEVAGGSADAPAAAPAEEGAEGADDAEDESGAEPSRRAASRASGTRPPTGESAARRTTSHVVRRSPTHSGRTPAPAPSVEAGGAPADRPDVDFGEAFDEEFGEALGEGLPGARGEPRDTAPVADPPAPADSIAPPVRADATITPRVDPRTVPPPRAGTRPPPPLSVAPRNAPARATFPPPPLRGPSTVPPPRTGPAAGPAAAPPPMSWDRDDWGEGVDDDTALFESGVTRAGPPPVGYGAESPDPPTLEQDRPSAAALIRATRTARAESVEERELDAALEGAVAMGDGTLVRPSSIAGDLVQVDVAPDLPASPFATAELDLDFDAIKVTDVEPSTDDRTEELARDLVLYERELVLVDEPGPTARLRLEAGRLAEQLGDLDRARTHYDSALQLDPRLRPPLRALRRVERALGNIPEAIRHLEAEIELSSAQERRALAAYRADLLMASGEQDVARVAVGDLVDEAPADVRALLADLELAWVDGRKDELDSILDHLAQAVADRALAGAMARTRGLLAEARGADGGPAYRGALLVDPADRLAWMGLAHAALARGEASDAAELTGHLVGQGGLGQAAPALGGALEWRRGEALIGRGELAAASRSIARAAELLPGDPDLGEVHAILLEAGGQTGAAGVALARAARAATSPAHAARLLRRAARLHAAAGDAAEATALLRQAVERDPDEPLAAIDLTSALEAAGQRDGLIDLARHQVDADPEGAVLARLHLARELEQLGRAGEAIAVLVAGRDAGVRSAALDAELERVYTRADDLAGRTALRRQQADEKLPYLDPIVAARRAAASLEELARLRAPAPASNGAAPGRAAPDRTAPAPAAPPPAHGEVDADDADLFFAAPSASPGASPAPEAAGLPAGIWREPRSEPLGPSSAPSSASSSAQESGEDLAVAALAAWRRVLELDPSSAAARAGAVRLAERGPIDEQLAVLAEAQRGESQPTSAIELALRRAELLLARPAAEPAAEPADDPARPDSPRAEAEDILAAAAQLDGDDPRSTHALLRLLAADGRWADAASLLADRADALGDGDQAIAYRYRAATMLLERPPRAVSGADEPGQDQPGQDEIDERRAVDLLTAVVHARPAFVIAAELLRAAQRRLGESPPPLESSSAAPPAGERRERDEGFARFLREAEMVEQQVGDPGRAAALYQRALELRPDDPLARDGFARNAERGGEASPLAELALADLRQAEAMGDGVAKATAYEELARIDAELRGDLASAILGWGAAVESDPTRMTALRSLERAYLAAGAEREPDLYQLYGHLLEALAGDRDTAAMLAELARLAARADRPQDEVLGHFRRLHALDPASRTALFRLEAHARAQGPSRALADLEQAVARSYAGDPRAEAAFHTRAGETLRALGDRDGAVQSFRAAVVARPDHGPALIGWRDAAIAGGLWLEAADAAERAADAATDDHERAGLYHLAGVALMDRALDGERAIALLRRVMEVEPGHTDGFLRLKLLYEETGQDVELVELYHQRLAVEQEPAMRVALHQGLASLYRNFFDDREGARRHLRSALALDAGNLRAVADLSDIAWELGDWAEAAESLIARAKLEARPPVLRQIFYRLGMIYADRLPDPRYAMMSFQKVLTYDPTDTAALAQVADLAARSGDHRLALGACEQLIKLTPVDADKVPHLHRVARVYLDGLHDRQKAERAYRIALDLDPTSEAALAALVAFYTEVGDAISARVHLDRVAGAMRQRIAAQPGQIHPYQVLARALEAREQAGAAGSLAAARAAAEIAVLFGSTEPRDVELAAGAAHARPPLGGLAAPEVDDLLFPAPVSSSLRALFRLLGDRIPKQLGLDVRRYGVGRAERLRMGGDPLAGMVVEMAGEMGIDEIEVYVSARQPTVLAVEPTTPPSLVLGAHLASLDRPAELRFLVGRALKLARASLAVPARMNVDELGALLAGILRQFSPEFAPEGIDPVQIAAEQQKLRRLIPHNMVQELAPFGLEIAGAAFDHRAVWAGIIEGGNRAGILAAGSATAALGAVLRLGGYRDIHQGMHDPFVLALLRFAVSEDHAALRAQLDS